MTDTFRALCAELLEALDSYLDQSPAYHNEYERLVDKVRAALAVSPPAHSRELAIGTTCNLRYNNRGIIHGGVPCRAGFTRGRKGEVRLTELSPDYTPQGIVG